MSGPVPGSPEWIRLVTASKAGPIIGVSPWDSPRSMWHKMTTGEWDAETEAMRRGTLLEPAIVQWWIDRHPEATEVTTQTWHPLDDWAGATPDAEAMIDDERVLVEAKSASRMDDWGDAGTDAIPATYLAQAYFSLALSGAARCYVPVIGPYLEFSEYVVESNPEFERDILARCRTFYDSLAADEPPELDGHVATYNTVRKQHADIDDETVDLTQSDAHEFVASALALDAAESRARLARSTLLDLMGRAKRAEYAGAPVARRQNAKHGVNLVRICKTTAALTPKPKEIAS